MKKIALLIGLLSACAWAAAQKKENPKYDSVFAKTLKGDENGMKKYFLAILKTGTNIDPDKATKDSLFAGHFKNMNQLSKEGKLAVAGPLGKNDRTYRGIFILNAETKEEAQALVATDPAVKGKIFEVELYQLWSTAGLMEIPNIHEKIHKYAD